MRRHFLLILIGLCLGLQLRAEAFPVFGVDSISSEWLSRWYLTGDLGHYLDNMSDHVTYEAETTGEWNAGDQYIFSVDGNSFRQSKYVLNDMRLDSRFAVGSTPFHSDMRRTSLLLDYQEGVLRFRDDSVQVSQISIKGNVGNLGGISPGTKQLINLFHRSGAERTMDDRAINYRQHTVGAGTAEATFAIPAFGRSYFQHAYATVGWRQTPALDETGITGMTPSNYYKAQLDGELPLPANKVLDHLHYFVVANGRSDLYSEFYYNHNETATQRAVQTAMYATKAFANSGHLVAGLSYGLNNVRHNDLCFSRNLVDHDGEAFDPWYADGLTNELNASVQYDQRLLPWLRVHYEGYNSFVHFRPTTAEWHNDIYLRNMDGLQANLYTYQWQSASFGAGLLENAATVVAEKTFSPKLALQAHVGVSLDGILLRGKSVVSPNALAKMSLDVHPNDWFQLGVTIGHFRQSYTLDEVRYLSNDYLNGEIRYADGTLLATTGGSSHQIEKGLWMRQPSYFLLDVPIRFTFGKSRRHEFSLLSSARRYYHQWFTSFTDGVDANMLQQDNIYYMRAGEKQYTVGSQPAGLMSGRWLGDSPYFLSNVAKYAYNGKKVFVSVSWQSYLMAGLSSMGSGPLHNNIGSLSESTANPNTFVAVSEENLPYQGNCRLNQDRSFIARIQFTYNPCPYFSMSINGKFKDGQPFSNYYTSLYSENGHTQAALRNNDAKGINMANQAFGKREDAFFNIDLRLTGRWWAGGVPMELEAMCYNIYDFGTALTEYTFDDVNHPTYDHWTIERGIATMLDSRTSMTLCIPRGMLFTLRVGLEKTNR